MMEGFKPLEKVDIPAFFDFNDDLKELLEQIDAGIVFGENGYSYEQLTELLASFVRGQRGSLGRTKEGSWSIAPDDRGMDSDARVDFIFFPTYLVTAILSRVLLDYPDLTKTIPGYVASLKKGLLFCSYRGLYGHGYGAESEAAEALTILSMGRVPLLLERDETLCPELCRAIEDVAEMMQKRLDTGSAFGMWGEDLQEAFSTALETMIIREDREIYNAIRETDENSELLSEEDMPW